MPNPTPPHPVRPVVASDDDAATATSTSALVRYGLAAFAVGVVVIGVTFVGYAAGDDNRPLAQNLACLLAPLGFGMALVGVIRSGRADSRRVAALYPSGPRPAFERRPRPRTVAIAMRWTAMAEASSWLLLIVATGVKYLFGPQIGVQILGPVHGTLFLGYLAVVAAAWWSLRWSLRTVVIVVIDSLLPGGGFLVARRRDLRPS